MEQNPFAFHEEVPEMPSPTDQQEVMNNIFLKGFMMNVLELFLGVFGIAAASSIFHKDHTSSSDQ